MTAPTPGNQGQKRLFRPKTPLVIGLVGGIASGKSEVAGLFARHGILHVNADFHAKAVSEAPEVVQEVADRLGAQFVRDGKIDRMALGDHVFRVPEAKLKLEAIVHPRVRAEIHSALESALAEGQSALLDVPLLFEAGLFEICHAIVFVDADEEVRSDRARSRGWPTDELSRRERNQLPLAEKRARSQHVIDNNDTLTSTAQAVEELLSRLESNA